MRRTSEELKIYRSPCIPTVVFLILNILCTVCLIRIFLVTVVRIGCGKRQNWSETRFVRSRRAIIKFYATKVFVLDLPVWLSSEAGNFSNKCREEFSEIFFIMAVQFFGSGLRDKTTRVPYGMSNCPSRSFFRSRIIIQYGCPVFAVWD